MSNDEESSSRTTPPAGCNTTGRGFLNPPSAIFGMRREIPRFAFRTLSQKPGSSALHSFAGRDFIL
ncbi:MAG: hypothetical protein D6679_03480 [Candidatus Hydrogenedentota bacterium]|nr:MAG: hypothetical protein D6679_03480 [Candidatus Hydrogenedentota bacterium]